MQENLCQTNELLSQAEREYESKVWTKRESNQRRTRRTKKPRNDIKTMVASKTDTEDEDESGSGNDTERTPTPETEEIGARIRSETCRITPSEGSEEVEMDKSEN